MDSFFLDYLKCKDRYANIILSVVFLLPSFYCIASLVLISLSNFAMKGDIVTFDT